MSRFLSDTLSSLTPYTPGEQPREKKYIKLNTNESPYPPSDAVINAVKAAAQSLQLYSDPESLELTRAVAEKYGLSIQNVLMTNGSDEILNFAFAAFSDKNHPIAFPDITYGFYSVFAELYGIPYERIPLCDDFTIDYRKYCGINKNIVIANPNAPTGIILPLSEIEEIVRTNPDNVVIIDEAYIDFGGKSESAVKLIGKYDNLLVTQTFSKSRSLAGARLGFGMGSPELIADLNTLKYSTNPYNVNRMTAAAGIAALSDSGYYEENCKKIVSVREYTKAALEAEGFSVLKSSANFLFAKADYISGTELYNELKREGILVRHFDTERLKGYNRITIGTKDEMDKLLEAVRKIKNKE